MELKDIIELMHAGSGGALLLVAWIAYRIGDGAKQALKTLEAINANLTQARAEIKEVEESSRDKLERIHDDLQKLPLLLRR